MKKFSLIFLTFTCFNSFLFAADVFKYDISGIRLGMSGEQAVSAIEKFYGNDASIETLKAKNQYTKKEEIVSIVSRIGENTKVMVQLAPRLASNLNSVVSEVYYFTGPWTEKGYKDLQSASSKKYGKPTTIEGQTYYWCANTKEHCVNQPYLSLSYQSGGGMRSSTITSLVLTASSLYRQEISDKQESLKKMDKPRF